MENAVKKTFEKVCLHTFLTFLIRKSKSGLHYYTISMQRKSDGV